MGRKRAILVVAALLAALGLALLAPVVECRACGGLRDPALDLDPRYRKEIESQIRVCSACAGRGRVTLLAR